MDIIMTDNSTARQMSSYSFFSVSSPYHLEICRGKQASWHQWSCFHLQILSQPLFWKKTHDCRLQTHESWLVITLSLYFNDHPLKSMVSTIFSSSLLLLHLFCRQSLALDLVFTPNFLPSLTYCFFSRRHILPLASYSGRSFKVNYFNWSLSRDFLVKKGWGTTLK